MNASTFADKLHCHYDRSSKVKYPKFLSTDSLNLLKALLTRDPAKRLGAGPQGAEAVRRHPFFK
jgi:hypothetical protein